MPKPLPAALHVREVIQDDIPSIVELLIAAPDDGTLYQFPNFQKYPNRSSYIQWLRAILVDCNTLVRVAVIEQLTEEKIVGFSCWIRRVPDLNQPGKTCLREWRKATWIDGLSTFK
jgi:hypothetical protein